MIEHDLRELAERLEWPQTPDIARTVEREVADLEPGVRHEDQPRRRRRWLAAALAMLVLVPAGAAFGDDVLEWLGLKSVAVERVPRLPEDAKRPVVGQLGAPVSLADAERRAGFTPVVPDLLGDPQEIRLDGRVVTLVYDEGDTLLAQLPGTLDEQLLTKIAGPGTDVRRLPDGLFFSGREHVYLYRRPGGGVAEDRPRLAGNTFVTERGNVLLRLEARELTPERARAVLR